MQERKVDTAVLLAELEKEKEMNQFKSNRAKNHWALLRIYYGPQNFINAIQMVHKETEQTNVSGVHNTGQLNAIKEMLKDDL